jgi:hypothetical protein
LRVLPAAVGTRGGELVKLAERLGYRLDGWQRIAGNDVLATDEDGALAAFEAVLLVSRQCGKSLIGELYALLWALEGQTVLHTSHRADAAKELFRRMVATIPDEWGAKPTFTNGKEQLELPGGGVILFRTRGPRVGRGFTIDKLIVDECQVLSTDELDAAMPTLRTRPDAQVLYLGTAPNAHANANCEVLYGLRERARRGDSEALCWLEWSAAAVDDEGEELSAERLPEAVLDDEEMWRQATPALESGRITLDRIRTEREAMDPVSFAVEILTVGVWPDTELGAGPVSVVAWNELEDPDSELDPDEPVPHVVVGFDMSPDRRVSVSVVGRRADRLLHHDHVGRFDGTNSAIAAIVSIYERTDAYVMQIVCDGEPQNLDLMGRLKDHVGDRVLRTENASRVGVQSCGALVDLVNEERFRHRGQVELSDAIRGAVVKTFSDSWVYSRARSRGDVSPLLAAAAALWAADQELSPDRVSLQVF